MPAYRLCIVDRGSARSAFLRQSDLVNVYFKPEGARLVADLQTTRQTSLKTPYLQYDAAYWARVPCAGATSTILDGGEFFDSPARPCPTDQPTTPTPDTAVNPPAGSRRPQRAKRDGDR